MLNVKDFGEYQDLYNIIDILLLKNIYKNCNHGILRQKKAKMILESLIDVDMMHVHGNGITGGITRAVHHQAEASNKYRLNYEKLNENSFIVD